MFVTHLNLNKGVEGFLKNGLLEIHKLQFRHDEIVREMERRGYQHKSELLPLNNLRVAGSINREENLKILFERCHECRQRQELEKVQEKVRAITTPPVIIVPQKPEKVAAKPQCSLVGIDGNVFVVIGHVAKTLKRAGLVTEAQEFQTRAFSSSSYDSVLRLCFEYVEII